MGDMNDRTRLRRKREQLQAAEMKAAALRNDCVELIRNCLTPEMSRKDIAAEMGISGPYFSSLMLYGRTWSVNLIRRFEEAISQIKP